MFWMSTVATRVQQVGSTWEWAPSRAWGEATRGQLSHDWGREIPGLWSAGPTERWLWGFSRIGSRARSWVVGMETGRPDQAGWCSVKPHSVGEWGFVSPLCLTLHRYVKIRFPKGGNYNKNKSQRDTLRDKMNSWLWRSQVRALLRTLCAGRCRGMLSLPSGAASPPPLLLGLYDSLVLRRRKELIKWSGCQVYFKTNKA